MAKRKSTTQSSETPTTSGTGVPRATLPAKKSNPAGSQALDKQTTLIVVALFVGMVALAVLYMFTGQDPLSLFTDLAATPPAADSVGDAASAGGDWWQVYFTDPLRLGDPAKPEGSIAADLIRRIDGAQRSIHIAAFEFDLTPIADALIAAHRRGVEVRWVTDDEHGIEADAEEGHGQFALLVRAGIEVKDDGRSGLMHNKFIVFDERTVWTGATNLTVNGIFRNNNNAIAVDSVRAAAIYEREFAEMWAGQFGGKSPSTADDQLLTFNGTPIRILFAPEDDVIEQLVPLVAGARQRIRFMAFSFTQEDLGAAVLARAQAGVDVRGIFETRGSETDDSRLGAFFCAGLAVRQDGNPSTFHHKVFVIDDEIVITGSFNFSNNADRTNDENVLIITQRDIAAQYLQEFDRRWAEGKEPDKAEMTCKK